MISLKISNIIAAVFGTHVSIFTVLGALLVMFFEDMVSSFVGGSISNGTIIIFLIGLFTLLVCTISIFLSLTNRRILLSIAYFILSSLYIIPYFIIPDIQIFLYTSVVFALLALIEIIVKIIVCIVRRSRNYKNKVLATTSFTN